MVEFYKSKIRFTDSARICKVFYPDIIEVDGCFLLKDKYSSKIFKGWKKDCNNNKTDIEKMMNLYEVGDFFHINRNEDENKRIVTGKQIGRAHV